MSLLRRSACTERPDGAVIHRTSPLYLGKTRRRPGYFVGHACDCRRIVLTENGNQSEPVRLVPARRFDDPTVVVTQAHARRIKAAS